MSELKSQSLLQIEHLTTYRYATPVALGKHRLYLYPRTGMQARVVDFQIEVQPDAKIIWGRDAFENTFAQVNFHTTSDLLQIKTESEVFLQEENPFDFELAPEAIRYPFPFSILEKKALSSYLEVMNRNDSSQVFEWIYSVFPSMPDQTMDILLGINQRIFSDFQYLRREEEGIQTPNQTLQLKSGSCRDFSLLFLVACQYLGFPARFVSGYLSSVGCGGMNDVSDRAEGSMHAWVEVFLPGVGWKGFDPTNGILTTSSFITCAVSHQPDFVSPIQGTFTGMQQSANMDVNLTFKLKK